MLATTDMVFIMFERRGLIETGYNISVLNFIASIHTPSWVTVKRRLKLIKIVCVSG